MRVSILFLLFVFSSLTAKEDHRVEPQPAALSEALSIANRGILKQKENGFVYLDVSNALITSVVPLLDYPGLLRARPTSSKSMGAHISVFDEKEAVQPVELGDTFSFEVKEIRSFTLKTRDGLKKLWVIAINSEELENLRDKYGCSRKLKGFDFHITLAKQMPAALDGWEKIEEFSSFNFSDEETIGLSVKGDFVTVEHSEILETAAKVHAVAQLKLKGNGFVYLDVDNQYIDAIKDQLPLQNIFEAVSTKPKKMGAHISVIHEDEMIKHEIWSPDFIGQWVSFEVKELRYVDRKTAKGMERLWLLAVDAPALERLRMHYGLKPKLQGHDFHITIGTELLQECEPIDEEALAAAA